MNTFYLIQLIFLGLFVVLGFLLVFMPVEILRRIDHRTGKTIVARSPNEITGIKRAAIFYRALGCAFILLAGLIFSFIRPSIFVNDQSQIATERYVNWIIVATTTEQVDNGRGAAPIITTPVYDSDIKQLYVFFYTKALDSGSINYRWVLNGKVLREFAVPYHNGNNFVPLNDDLSQMLKSGNYEIHMSNEGKPVALLRFKVK